MIRSLAPSFLLAVAATGSACMGIGPEPVRFMGQTNIIVWDERRGVEHFIRDARFETAGKSLGFIAPTPTPPRIEAAKSAAFARLAALAPDAPRSQGSGGFGGGGGLGGGGGVAVVARKVVSGYEATVLKATDPQALAEWLDANGYPMPPYAVRWTAPYIRKGWYLTAFKVATEAGAGATGPVKMTFRTRMPFNPYSVPAENGGGGGLSLYYVSAGQETPKIGGTRAWVSLRWRARLDEEATKGLTRDLEVDVPKESVVRFYRDEGFGRPGFDDVYFVPEAKGIGFEAALLGFAVCAMPLALVRRVNPVATRADREGGAGVR